MTGLATEILIGIVGAIVSGLGLMLVSAISKLNRASAQAETRDESMRVWLDTIQTATRANSLAVQECTVSLAAALASQTSALEALERRQQDQAERQQRISDRVRAIESGSWPGHG